MLYFQKLAMHPIENASFCFHSNHSILTKIKLGILRLSEYFTNHISKAVRKSFLYKILNHHDPVQSRHFQRKNLAERKKWFSGFMQEKEIARSKKIATSRCKQMTHAESARNRIKFFERMNQHPKLLPLHKQPAKSPAKQTNYIQSFSFKAEACEKTFCAWGAHCVNAPDGRALCQCPTHCLDTVDLVCGTDNKTYKNHCQLRVASCKARQSTRVKHTGECGKRFSNL